MNKQDQLLVNDQVVMALREGNHDAYEKVFVAYFPRVKYYVNNLTRSSTVAEELTQEVFARLWENHALVKPSVRSLTSFLFTIAHRVAIDFLRGRRVRESYCHEQTGREEETVSTEDSYMARELYRVVKLVVEQMPARQREIFKMSRLSGMSNEEIATRLAINKRTVENQLSLALRKIKEMLG
ncbi:MAG: RNA polymerase sigma-70 factor [Odoribacteraceae bacterium]|jgi:RNA polymerase sigma-70 factor (ECF subfamily)|nr:RNA polymerase sigma-70 factor [Odoribacteraceae bacterium]